MDFKGYLQAKFGVAQARKISQAYRRKCNRVLRDTCKICGLKENFNAASCKSCGDVLFLPENNCISCVKAIKNFVAYHTAVYASEEPMVWHDYADLGDPDFCHSGLNVMVDAVERARCDEAFKIICEAHKDNSGKALDCDQHYKVLGDAIKNVVFKEAPIKDLTMEGIEPNPGPPLRPSATRSIMKSGKKKNKKKKTKRGGIRGRGGYVTDTLKSVAKTGL